MLSHGAFYKTVITIEKISMHYKDYKSLLLSSVVIVVVPAAIVQAQLTKEVTDCKEEGKCARL